MDSLKTLIEKKQYNLVLDLTKNNLDIDAISFRISAYLGLGQLEEALQLIKKYQSKFKDGLYNIMRVHFEVLLTLKKYDEAFEELKYYQNLPYISQEVEEYLNEANSMIHAYERHDNKTQKRSKDEIISILKHEEDSLVLLTALNDIREYNINEFADLLIWFMKRKNINAFVATYPLLLLVHGGYDQTVSFTKNAKLYSVVPKNLEPPFVNENYQSVIRIVEQVAKDPAISEVAISLLNELIIILYPDNIFDIEKNLLSGALLSLAYEYFQIKRDDEALAQRLNFNKELLQDLVVKLNRDLKDNPPVVVSKQTKAILYHLFLVFRLNKIRMYSILYLD